MSQRITRINALLQREISEQMRRYYRSDTAAITISDVSVSADLRNAKIYYSVLGDDAEIAASQQLFRRIGKDIRRRVSREITLKYFPAFYYARHCADCNLFIMPGIVLNIVFYYALHCPEYSC